MKKNIAFNPVRVCQFSPAAVVFEAYFCDNLIKKFGGCDDVVFSGKDGVFMNLTPLKTNELELSAKIMRHTSPDYQTHLVSS